MIIKSHIRGHLQKAADYLKDKGLNESVRLVEMSDFDAKTLDDAFLNMWKIASHSYVKKLLHHISINPPPEERLTDKQLFKIIDRCEMKYGYQPHDHQRVIVEHIKKGRQHFHVMWSRASLTTGMPISPGYDRYKSIKVAREMEIELGLKPSVRRKKMNMSEPISRRTCQTKEPTSLAIKPPSLMKRDDNQPDTEKLKYAKRPDQELAELFMWVWEHRRIDILQSFGIVFPPGFEF